MKVITKKDFTDQKDVFIAQIKSGCIFIHPTDSMYGIGCNSLINKSIKRIRELKGVTTPFSLIVPSVEWIYQNCVVNEECEEWIKTLPGPFTLVLPLKNKGFFSQDLLGKVDTVSVRFPNHFIVDIVKELGYPLVSTGVNRKEGQFMTSVENLDPVIEEQVDLLLYEGERVGKPSKIVRFDS